MKIKGPLRGAEEYISEFTPSNNITLIIYLKNTNKVVLIFVLHMCKESKCFAGDRLLSVITFVFHDFY